MSEAIAKLIAFLKARQGRAELTLSAAERRELLAWAETVAGDGAARPSSVKAKSPAGASARQTKGKPPAGATALLHCDGACRGNPGPSAAGFVIYLDGEELYGGGEALGRMTNNQAEYHALILGLKTVAQLGFKKLEVALDSELIVRQLEGRYKVKNQALKPLYEEARLLLLQFASWKVRHVPRAENARADALANEALDSI